jgi:hypothetical protein
MMKLWKFLVTDTEPVIVNGLVYDCISSFVVAEAASEAREELRKHLSLIFTDPVEYAWLDFVEPIEIDISAGPRVVGFVRL